MKKMLRFGLFAPLILVILSFSAPQVFAQTEEDLQKMYVKFLREEGYAPKVDEDGDVRFKYQGMTYFIDVNASDPKFFRVVLANFWEIESETERLMVLVAADHSNASSKISKIYTIKDNMWLSLELALPKAEDFEAVFERSMGAMQNGVQSFKEKMNELNKGLNEEKN